MKLKRQALILFTLLTSFIVFACFKSAPKFSTKKAHSRVFAIYAIPAPSAAEAADENSPVAAVRRSLEALYDSRVEVLSGEATLQQDLPPRAVSEAALKQADDLLLLLVPRAGVAGESANVGVRLISLADMREKLKLEIPTDGDGFETQFKAQMAQGLPDPDATPRAESIKIAQYLESRGNQREALSVYEFLYQQKTGNLYLHEIDARDQLERKIRDLREAVGSQDMLAQDQNAVYALNLEYENIGRNYQEMFKDVVTKQKLYDYFSRFSSKPVTLRLSFDATKQIAAIRLMMRFHKDWYWREATKEPAAIGGQRLLHFSPYFGAMFKLTALRNSFAQRLQAAQAELPGELVTALVLQKVSGDEVEVPVEAKPDGKLLYPYELRVHVHGYEDTMIEAGNKRLFDRRGFFAVGPANLLSGQRTQWGLLYDFFGIPDDLPAEMTP